VIALGEVGDVREFYGRVRCVLNPMLGGTGLKIKTVEALAFGLPLLGTPDAFVGIAGGESACILPDVEAMAARMEEISADPGLLTALRQESRRLFLDYLSGVHAQLDTISGRIRAAA
jgi:glycosyltransferase involved in cell wall biosynthesis